MPTPLELLIGASRLARERALRVVDGLSGDQLAWRPSPTAHSLGWTLWHLARSADRYRAELPGSDGVELWTAERLAERWKIPSELMGRLGVGSVDIADADAARVPLPAGEALIGYARKAFAGLDAAVGSIRDADLGAAYESISAADGRTTIGAWLAGSIAHDNRHLGEMEYVKGLLGLRGTVTR